VSTFGTYTSNDRLFDGSFNMVNEITSLTKSESGGSPVSLPFTYDKAGQIEEKATSASGATGYLYRHDAWGRLVKVQFDGGNTTSDRELYQYNGLHMRVIKQADGDVFDVSDAPDEQRLMFYTAAGAGSLWRSGCKTAGRR
jgi:hypothetical protein